MRVLSHWCLISISALRYVARAQAIQVPVSSCSNSAPAPQDQQLNFETVFAQWDVGQTVSGSLPDESGHALLRLVGFGTVATESEGYSSITGFLATVLAGSSVLSFETFSNDSALCASLVSANGSAGCPYGPGSFGFGLQIPFAHAFPLATIINQIRILDTSSPSLELACLQIPITPYYPHYFAYALLLWLPISLILVYLVVILVARSWAACTQAALHREAELASSLTSKLSPHNLRDTIGPLFWDVASGTTLRASAALQRFATPCVRDWLWFIQYIAMLGMVAVRWPQFAYPILAKAAWSMLIYRIPLTQDSGRLSSPLEPYNASIPSDYSSVVNDSNSVIYLNQSLPNNLLDFGDAAAGLESLAVTLGIDKSDLFGGAAAIFLILVGASLLASVAFLAIDSLSFLTSRLTSSQRERITLRDSPTPSDDLRSTRGKDDETSTVGIRYTPSGAIANSESRPSNHSSQRPFNLKLRSQSVSNARDGIFISKHARLAVANCIRLLLLFQLPLIILSVYQMSLLHNGASTASVALAILLFAALGVLIPAFLLFQIVRSSVDRLQEAKIFLTYGPLYNIYGTFHAAYIGLKFAYNLVAGIFIGSAQRSGLAQAIALLVVEITDTLLTSISLPWPENAVMGPIAFLFSVSRILTAILLIVLSQNADVSSTVAQWVAYVVLVAQGACVAFLFLLLIIKLAELFLRVIGTAPFGNSKSRRSTGFGGAVRGLGKMGRRATAAAHASRLSRDSQTLQAMNDYPRRRESYLNMDGYESAFTPALEEEYMLSHRWPSPIDIDTKGLSPSRDQSDYVGSHTSPMHVGFQVVRGGKATEASPYQLAHPSGARGLAQPAERVQEPRLLPTVEYFSHAGRPRARSFSADIEFAGPSSPTPLTQSQPQQLFSNQSPMSVELHETPLPGRHITTKSSVTNNLFASFGWKPAGSKSHSDPEDSEPSDAEGDTPPSADLASKSKRFPWPFRRTPTAPEERTVVQPSFSVVRRPRVRPTQANTAVAPD